MKSDFNRYFKSPLVGALSLLLIFPACSGNNAKQTHALTQKTSGISANLSRDFKAISQGVTPSVVSISTTSKEHLKTKTETQLDRERFKERFGFSHPPQRKDPESSLGSGVVVDAEKGYILTNNHVVENAGQIEVSLPNGKTFQAKIVGVDPPSDLAVIQAQNPPKLTAAVLGDSEKLRVGEWVLAIGSPFGLQSTVTAGIISAKGRADIGVADFEDFIQTDAAINLGNSGGALVNIKGEVVGINTAIASDNSGYMGIGFAIPSNLARKVMDALITQGRVIRSQLGVLIGPSDDLILKSLKISEQTKGILVMDVFPDSPAAKAGFKKYDLIVSLNQTAIGDVQPFRNQIALTTPGSKVKIKILRNGKTLVLEPVLREMNADNANPLEPTRPEILKKLDFEVQDLDDALRKKLQLPLSLQGVIVNKVDVKGSAFKQGLRVGDIITEANRQSVGGIQDFYQQLNQIGREQVLLMNLIRDQQNLILALKTDPK
jgi:serine protease Do